MNKKFIVIFFFLIALSYSLALLPQSFVVWVGQEDGLIEWLGALCFFGAGYAFYLSGKNSSGNKKVVFFLLSFLFFFAFGEEISWGQRVIGWGTPQAIQELNVQGETNIHNLTIFHGRNADGSDKSFYQKLLNLDRLFSLFCFGLLLGLPLLARISAKSKEVVMSLGIPISEIWIGVLLVVNYAVLASLKFLNPEILHTLVELREANTALIVLIFALTVKERKLKN